MNLQVENLLDYDVIIIGGGPAGLSAASILFRSGVSNLVVVEREQQPGGIPRHTLHPGFGFSQFGWPYFGPAYVNRLLRECQNVEIRTGTTVTRLDPGGTIEIADQSGLKILHARAVLITTGIRESPVTTQLVTTDRPWGTYTTGAIQQFLHLAHHKPCQRPVIVGSEWVSFSAVVTLIRQGIKPVAVLEENPVVTASPWGERFTKYMLRVPVVKHAQLTRIFGKESIEGIEFFQMGQNRVMECDSVIFTGQFIPEASLAINSHLEWDDGTRGPKIDQHWCCSDPAYFAAGNVLHPVESSGVCGREGKAAARSIVDRLKHPSLSVSRIPVEIDDPLRYIYPQTISTPGNNLDSLQFRTRTNSAASGYIKVTQNGKEIWKKKISTRREQRIRLPGHKVQIDELKSLAVGFTEC